MSVNKIQFHDMQSSSNEFLVDVMQGLSQRPASIPPKYFYDAKGSKLFDAITQLPEYYLTRTEIDILSANADEIARHVGTGSILVEPGGGSCAKVHILLDGLKPTTYVPMDISKDHLRLSAQELSVAFPWLEIHAIYTDFTRELRLPQSTPQGTHLAFFPGSSIGNFDPDGAVGFLTLIEDLVGSGGYLLIGVDLKKDKAILEAAYDDAAGITAQFNLNLLIRINRELDANFDITAWQHSSLYNEQLGRIEMHLVSKHNQVVTINNTSFSFTEGETIHTENSYKYSTDEFITLASRAGFQSDALWLDADKLFSAHLFRVPQKGTDRY